MHTHEHTHTRTTRSTRRAAALGLAFALALGLTACSGNDDQDAGAPAADHNDSDVTFASDMIPHHAQALMMVRLTQGRPLTPPVRRLTRQIRAAQAPEIATMRGWLTAWGDDGDGSMPGMDGMGGMDGMSARDGMMSHGSMVRLRRASDSRFESMWLRMMIRHHRGAVRMARHERQDGEYGPAKDLAASIISSQTEEIARMRTLLRR